MKLSIENNEIDVFAIGGLSEIGKSTYGIQLQDEITLVDAGIKFPEDDLLGIDYTIPDYSYIIQNLHEVKTLVVTYGHESRTGGIPCLLKQVSIPTYVGPLALALITNKLDKHGLLRDAELHEINKDTIIRFRKVSVSFFRTTHSVLDALGIVVKAPSGSIVATGDSKFDFTPVGEPASLHKTAHIGEGGILCLLPSSTNAETPIFTKSEKTIGYSILKIFSRIKGRTIFASLASNTSRLQQAVDAAMTTGRKVVVFRRSMENAVVSGQRLGYIKVPDGTFVDTHRTSHLSANETMTLCTGSQGEAMAMLSRITNGTHRQTQIQPDDTVIFSGSPISGNATSVNYLTNLLSGAGAEMIHGKVNNTHTFGHGGQEGQKLMLRLMRPKYLIPVHGEFRMLKVHAPSVQGVGVPAENCFITGDGDVLASTSDSAYPTGHFVAGDVYIDDSGVGDVSNVVLRDRHPLSGEGLVLAIATVDIKEKEVLASLDIFFHGFVYVRKPGEAINEAQRILFHALRRCLNGPDCSEYKLKGAMVGALQPLLFERVERHPMILPMVTTSDEE